jgi:hypothetical protein
VPGGYEEVAWNSNTQMLEPLLDGTGSIIEYDYTNTSLSVGDYEVTASVRPEIATEWPFPYLHGDDTEAQSIRVMHRMNIEAQMILEGINPIYYFDVIINNGDGIFGNWAILFHEEALNGVGFNFNDILKLKPYPTNWDG